MKRHWKRKLDEFSDRHPHLPLGCHCSGKTVQNRLRNPQRLELHHIRIRCRALELAIKTNSGKLQAAKLLLDFEGRVRHMGFFMQNVQTSDVIRSGLLPFHHRDPFDRLLAAQSVELDIPLISRDAVFDQYGVKRIW